MLRHKTVFVAGSSRGIGLAIARGFLHEGARVVITGRRADALMEARAELVALAGADRVLAVQGNLTDQTDIRRVLETSLSEFGALDAVIGNLGSGSARGGWDLTPEDWKASLEINLLGSMSLASSVLPCLIERGRGSLTFISSIAGREAISAPLTYSAAKAALQAAVKGLSRLVGEHGVRVNAVAPGNVLFPGGAWDRKLADDREWVESYIRSEVPLRRFAGPNEVADAVMFLTSDRASFITGACLVVDGGQTHGL